MKTRSQTRAENLIQNKDVNRPLFTLDIDFDEASRAWNANKKRMPNGEYRYICRIPECKRKPLLWQNHCNKHTLENLF
jgi:hypothetical protein